MDRRGGMAPMMPFFPGNGMVEQPASMPAPDMPPFPHMRERFPNSVWAPDGNQNQWGAFHPPGLPPPPMGPPAHPAHQYNQFEPRQAVFNFQGSTTSQAPNHTVAQFNNGFSGQYNGNPETVTGYVPQGHFSPQTSTTSVPYSSGATSGFLVHPQGNGVINTTNAQAHSYPPSNEYAQPSHHSQQGIFKSPMPSPAVSGAEQSPIQTAFTVSSMPSPHTSNNHNEQAIIPSSVPCQVPVYSNHPTTDCTATLPQNSPHANSTPCSSMSNNNTPNVNSSVQSRLKTMIMSRQGTIGSHGSAFSPGLSDSPPPGELRFSGSVAAVTSVESSPDPSQVQESIKMAQNFLAYRTADSGPGSVVQHSSDKKGGSSGEFTVTQKPPQNSVVNEKVKSDCDTLVTNLTRAEYSNRLQPNERPSINMNKEVLNCTATVNQSKTHKCEPMYQSKPDSFKQPEEALEELFNGTKQSEMDAFLTENTSEGSINTEHMFSRDNNFLNTTGNEVKNNELVQNLPNNCERSFIKPTTTDKRQSGNKAEPDYLSRCASANPIMEQSESQSYEPYSMESCQKQNMLIEPSPNIVRSEKGKSSSLSVYDFPDSPDQKPATQKGCAGFRLGRVRGAGLPITTTSTHCRPVCASAPLCGGSNMPSNTHMEEDGRGIEGSEQAKVHSILLENTVPPSLSHPQPFISHVSSASALTSTVNPQYTSFLPTTTVNSSCTTIPSLVGKDGHSSLHNKEQNCISQSFQKQSTATMPLSTKLSSLNQRQIENFSCNQNVNSDTSNTSIVKSCNNSNQMSTQTSESMSNFSKNNTNFSFPQQSATFNAFYEQQRNAMFNSQSHPPFPQSSPNAQFFLCNNTPSQPNAPFNMQSQNAFNPKTGMPHTIPVVSYGNSSQVNLFQNPYFYQQCNDGKVPNNPENIKQNRSISQQSMQSTPSPLESLQNISKNNAESKTVVPSASPQQSPKSAPHVSPIAHSTPTSNSSLHGNTPQPLTPNVNHSSNQSIPHISPQRSSPQDMNQPLSQSSNSHSAIPHGSVQSVSFIMNQRMSNPSSMATPQQSQNPLQSMSNPIPMNMTHRSPQNIGHPSPQNIMPHLSPQGVQHPSPQSMPLSSPQNMQPHQSPQNLLHPSPQSVSHLPQNMHSQNLLQQSPQTMPQPQASPQNVPPALQASLPQGSPQRMIHPTTQTTGHPLSINVLHPSVQNTHMPLIIHQTPNQQSNLPLKNSPPHQNVLSHHNTQHPATSFNSNPQNISHLPNASSFSRPSPHSGHPTASYSMTQSPAQAMNNPATHGIHPSFAPHYPPYGMPYQSINPGYQHRMYSPMHMGSANQVFPNCQHPIKSMSNITMPQNMQPCIPSEPVVTTKSRPKKGAPKKARKQKETKKKAKPEDIEKPRIPDLTPQQSAQQQCHTFTEKKAMFIPQNQMGFHNNQVGCQQWSQILNDGNMQNPSGKMVPIAKIENFASHPMQFQSPQNWNPVMVTMSNPKQSDLYPDKNHNVPQNKPLPQDTSSLGNPCFLNREEYTPLNSLNQQQSEIFKNIFDDNKTGGPGDPAKFEVHKDNLFNSPDNNSGIAPNFPSKTEGMPSVSTIPAAVRTNNTESSQDTLNLPDPPTSSHQLSYSEQSMIEDPVKQETTLGEQINQNFPLSVNTQHNTVKLDMSNLAPENQQHPVHPSYQVLANNVKEEAQQESQPSSHHSSLVTPSLFQSDEGVSNAIAEVAIQLPMTQNQNLNFPTEVKVPLTEDISFTNNDMEMEQIKNRMRTNELLTPKCSCAISAGTPDSGPVYTHLGAGSSLIAVQERIQRQTGFDVSQIRIEKVLFSGKDGKTESGCPLPKWIIRRGGPEEKVLVVVKQRLEHTCDAAWIVIVIVAWQGFSSSVADNLYTVLVEKLNKFGNPTERRCGTNEDRTCACQGDDVNTCGSSYSFGCSWSMYYNMCKFARSKNTRKFKLSDEKEEKEVEEKLQSIATSLAPVYERMAPIAYQHQVALEEESLECRLGNEPGRPWTGVTACMDFCSHAHKDSHNIHNGCTVVATLTKGHSSVEAPANLREQTPPDEQLHVLPLYLLDTKDENGSSEAFDRNVKSGAVQVLTKYPFPMRLRSEPLLSCRARNLLARGLPLPNSIRGKAKAKAKVVSLANIRRKSSGDNIPLKKQQKSEVKEVSDKLGLDVDLLLASGDLEDNCDEFSKYSIDSDDYSWIFDLGNDDENVKNTSNSQPDQKDESKEANGTSTETKLMPGYSGIAQTFGVTGNMPPPQSPAPRRTNSPGGMGGQHSTASPVVSPSMGLTLQSPIESPPPVLTPVPNLSPFSPQMPHLSPHGSHSSPDSPKKVPQSCEIPSVPSSVAEQSNSLSVSHASLFTASHNSPEMPRLSPHVNIGAFSPIGIPRPGDKVCPVSKMKQVTLQQPRSNLNHLHPEIEKKQIELSEKNNEFDNKPSNIGEDIQFNLAEKNFFENKDGSPHIFTRYSDNYQSFQDPNVGGVAIALTHGSVLFEYARQELHSTTALRTPNRKDPKRISLVFYHHKNLIYRNHGMKEFEEKMEKKRIAAEKIEKEGGQQLPTKKRKSNKRNKDDDKMEPLNGIKRMKFELDEGHLGMPEHKKGHAVSNKCATVFPPSHMHLPHHPDLISPPISYANYPHNLPSFVDGGRPYSPSSQRNSTTPAFTGLLSSKSPHLITSQSPSLDTYSQKPLSTPDHTYGTSTTSNHPNILPPFNTNLQEFNPYNGRGPSPYPGHFQPYMEMPGNTFSSYQPSGYFPKGHATPMNYNNTTYVPQPFYGLTPPYSPGPHGQTGGPVQSQMPFAPGPTQPITNPFDDSMRGGPMTNPTATWTQMRHIPSFHIHGPYSPWPGS